MRRSPRWWAGAAFFVALALVAGVLTWRERAALPAPPAGIDPPLLADELRASRARGVAWWHPRRREALREFAFLAHANGLWALADQAYARLQALEPARADWPQLKADVALNSGDAVSAVMLLEIAVAREPANAAAWARLGDLRYKQGQSSAAKKAWENALAADPAQPVAGLGLARLLADDGERDAALELLQKAISGDPAFGAPYSLLASLLAQTDQRQRMSVARALGSKYSGVPARPDPRLAEMLDYTRDVERLAVLADLALLRDEHEQARSLAVLSTRVDPRSWRAWLTAGVVNERLGQLDAARKAHEQALALGGDPVTLKLELASIAQRQGDYATARALLVEAEERGVSESRIRNALGEVERDAGRFAEAEARFRESLAADENQVTAARNLARLLWEAQRTKEAVPLLQRVRDADPLDFAVRATLGEHYASAGELSAACEVLHEAVDLEPRNEAIRRLASESARRLARELAGQRRLDEAAQRLRESIAFQPDAFEPLADFVMLASNTGRLPEALALVETYLQRRAADAKGWLLLGDLRTALGQPAAAGEAWRRAQAAGPGEPWLRAEIEKRLRKQP